MNLEFIIIDSEYSLIHELEWMKPLVYIMENVTKKEKEQINKKRKRN